MVSPGRQTGMYSTVLTNDKRSGKNPESQTKPEMVFQKRVLRRGSLRVTSGQRRKHKASQDVMTGGAEEPGRGRESGADASVTVWSRPRLHQQIAKHLNRQMVDGRIPTGNHQS